ncbi:hypothetical protein BLL52_1935 [Rhodoferax antarcticus ANT.BR]|uniref:Uncharacterized protein n=1 Tax=Rhodoferax antarcticus ANT.BR TaxID=1111071 RepID=A0A1Q8YCT4_9BURK|nr:hypothetical protein BLL52_1935 [Rhodoferax antarcticus ANT.BR]
MLATGLNALTAGCCQNGPGYRISPAEKNMSNRTPALTDKAPTAI